MNAYGLCAGQSAGASAFISVHQNPLESEPLEPETWDLDRGTDPEMHRETIFNIRADLLICLFLVITTLGAYWQVRDHEFVAFDDDQYVTKNPHVRAGLTLKGVAWAFTTAHADNWHPLTWLSHMLDVELYGMNPGQHHMTNLLFHIANTLLLFFVLKRMAEGGERREARSEREKTLHPSSFAPHPSPLTCGIAAALFALHPLHVESVAWVSERKDLLSAFFWMLTLWAYVRYVEHPKWHTYLTVILCFALGLMAKPMLVTLPFVLILLDYWPLDRNLKSEIRNPKQIRNPKSEIRNKFKIQNPKLVPDICCRESESFKFQVSIIEKLPFFILAALSSVTTFLVQQQGGAVKPLEWFPLDVRIANALVSTIRYLHKMLWPVDLAYLYPHPGMPQWWEIAGSAALLLIISLLAVRTRRTRPYFIVGWLWYLGTLVPVIGLVQVGLQSMADRYTYIPLIGIFVMIAWAVPEFPRIRDRRHEKVFVAIIAAAILLILIRTTYIQAGYWANSVTLFEHALEVTTGNYTTHLDLGVVLQNQGKINQAITHYKEALRIKPKFVEAHNNLGTALEEQGKIEAAIRQYAEALRISPGLAKTHNNMGIALEKMGRTDEASRHYAQALEIDPDNVHVRFNLGTALFVIGKINEATVHFREVLRRSPNHIAALNNLGAALFQKGKADEAIACFQKALRIKPDYVDVRKNLERVLSGSTKEKD